MSSPSDPTAAIQALSPGEFGVLLRELRSVRRMTDERLTSLERSHADRIDRLNRLWEATVNEMKELAARFTRLDKEAVLTRIGRIEEMLGIARTDAEPIRVQPLPKPKPRKVSRGNQ